MGRPPPIREFACQYGHWGVVEYARSDGGSYRAKEFYEVSLLETFGETNGKKVQRRLMGIFEDIAKYGDSPRMSGERGPIHGIKWEFSRKQIRIACFKSGDAWILTHGFFKKGAKKKLGDWSPEHLNRADRIRVEHLKYMRQSQ